MNKKVYKSMIVLILAFLVACYVAKIFFPEQFVMSVESEALVTAGNFIDTHRWLYYIVQVGLGVLFDYLYFGAVCQRTKLHWSLWCVVGCYNLALGAVLAFASVDFLINATYIITAISSCYMILVPLFYTNELEPLAITYCVNFVAQTLSLNIRGISYLMTNANTLTTLLMSFECYFWLLLLFLIFNFKPQNYVIINQTNNKKEN